MKNLMIRCLRSLLSALEGPAPYAPAMPTAQDIADAAVAAPPSVPASGFPSQRPRMYHVRIITSESRFAGLMNALERAGITGMTVTRVLGYGLQKGHNGMYTGAAIESQLLPKIQCDLVISKIPPETIIDIAKKTLYTGKYGDGKIFVSTIDNVVKIRTGEEGFDALQDKPL